MNLHGLRQIKPDTRLLDPMHYVNIVYNPSGAEIESQDSQTNIVSAMESGLSSMRRSNILAW